MNCLKCKFFEVASGHRSYEDRPSLGSCKRYPPLPVLDKDRVPVGYAFTPINASEWCGEFQPHETDQPAEQVPPISPQKSILKPDAVSRQLDANRDCESS